MSTLKQRFAMLAKEKPDVSQADLARATGAKPPSVHAWFSGDTKSMKADTASKAAEAYGCSSLWLATGAGPIWPVGSGQTLPDLQYNITPGPSIRGQIPLISWVRAGELCESHDNYHPGDAEHWMDCPVPHGPRTYCLEISGDSMDDGGSDAYRDGEIIFVDPDASADPGRDVVVRTPDNKTTFKRLKEDQEGQYLLGLNGKKIVRVPEDTVFCGVVIFSGRRR